jgi:hypothetical protein
MNLNFVLSIIFSSVVGIMSFVYGLAAIDKLAIRGYTDKGETFELMPVTAGWLITDFIPALLLLLLAEAAVYLTVTLRNAKAE